MNGEEKKILLQKLYDMNRICINCPYGKTEHNHKVFGTGNLNAAIMLIGEAPGAEEDLQKKPFVGRAGKLLNQCLEEVGLDRNNVFITNIIKCRPPGNRTPLPEEITNSVRNLLQQEITIIEPKILCTLGSVATKTLLATDIPMKNVRGKIYDFQTWKCIPTYHPAYILRNPSAKPDLINDINKAFLFIK